MMLHCSNGEHMHLQQSVQARDLINQLDKKVDSLLAISPVRCVSARHQKLGIYYLCGDDCDNIFP